MGAWAALAAAGALVMVEAWPQVCPASIGHVSAGESECVHVEPFLLLCIRARRSGHYTQAPTHNSTNHGHLTLHIGQAASLGGAPVYCWRLRQPQA